MREKNNTITVRITRETVMVRWETEGIGFVRPNDAPNILTSWRDIFSRMPLYPATPVVGAAPHLPTLQVQHRLA